MTNPHAENHLPYSALGIEAVICFGLEFVDGLLGVALDLGLM
jgi:hypothetical protein